MLTPIARLAVLAHDYTMDHVDKYTRVAIKRAPQSSYIDHEERRAVAWFGVVEHLYACEERPEGHELIFAGMNAIKEAITDETHSHGLSHSTNDTGANYLKFWSVRTGHTDFTDGLVDKIALPQVLAQLTANEYDAIAAQAVFGNAADSATSLGIELGAFNSRLRRARTKLVALWIAPETPATKRGPDTCRSGHSRSEHGFVDGRGIAVCRLCKRNSERRRRANGRTTSKKQVALRLQTALADATEATGGPSGA